MSARSDILDRFTRQSLGTAQIRAIESQTQDFHILAEDILDHTRPSREQSLALTALEEAKFWANQAIALHGLPQAPPTEGQS